jgi:hypothetical protein
MSGGLPRLLVCADGRTKNEQSCEPDAAIER